jgi:hypothetical protein
MEVRLTLEQDELIRQAVASGRCATPEDAVRERAALIASFEEAEADFEAGRGTVVTEENSIWDYVARDSELAATRLVTQISDYFLCSRGILMQATT